MEPQPPSRPSGKTGNKPTPQQHIQRVPAHDENTNGAIQQPLPGFEVAELRYESPLPPPAILEAYERLVPGTAAQFFDDAHEAAVASQKIAIETHRAKLSENNRGFIAAVAVTFTCVALAFISLFLFEPPESTAALFAFGLAGIAPVVLGFLNASKRPPSR